jgi:hypothetical protein
LLGFIKCLCITFFIPGVNACLWGQWGRDQFKADVNRSVLEKDIQSNAMFALPVSKYIYTMLEILAGNGKMAEKTKQR